MKAHRVAYGARAAGLERVEHELRHLGERDIRVRVHAVSLNQRDIIVINGEHGPHAGGPLIPCSDAAGEVMAVGAHVTRFKPGDRVVNSFFPHWVEGELSPEKLEFTLGFPGDGVLADEVVGDEAGWVVMPAHMSYAQAATLTCSGVTAWNALFVQGGAKPGDTVLLQGTGGVSVWGLALARAAGLSTLITSSSDAKLALAKERGATHAINYRTHPEWEREALRLTSGRGVDLVVDVGGGKTLAQSLAATRPGGTVAVTGLLSGIDTNLNILSLLAFQKQVVGVRVGSRRMLEDLCRFTEALGLVPVVDKTFGIEDARPAFDYLASGAHFGKVVIQLAA